MSNKVQRHYLLGTYQGRVDAYKSVVNLINDAMKQLPEESDGRLHLRALRGDVYDILVTTGDALQEWRRQVEIEDARDDAIAESLRKKDNEEHK